MIPWDKQKKFLYHKIYMFVRQINVLYLVGFGETATIFLLLELRNGEVRKNRSNGYLK